MATMRTYGDGCAIARGLDLVGERWALLVVRELLLGPKRYTDLRGGLPNASPNVLSQRLGDLERAGVVRRRKLPPPAGSRVYELTDWGRELEDTVMSLGRWAARSPEPPPRDAPIGVDSIILALRARFDSGAAHGLRAAYELRLGEDRFRIEVADDAIELARGDAHQADATIDTDPGTLNAVLWGDRSLAGAQRSGRMTIEGDKAAAERFVALFPRPEPISRPAGARRARSPARLGPSARPSGRGTA
jgi:DNA-binding HxlR family transcriptional regulator/putative sterol carrier protein